MTEVMNPADPLGKSSSQSQEQLSRSLDTLLKRYLHLLDQYQTLQLQLSKHLSAGYLSLAQANFTSPNRVRYGQDFYDERMQASRRVSITPPTPSTSSPNFSITALPHALEAVPDSSSTTATTKAKSLISEEKNTAASEAKIASKKKASNRDPLNWFGILVPPALRAAQKSFVDAITDPIPMVVEVEQEMRDVEEKIRNIRRELGKGG